MSNRWCLEDPGELFETQVCLSAVSKNLHGELHLLEAARERCEDPECETLKTLHLLRLEVVANPACDSRLSRRLDGVFYVRDLTHAFEGGDGNNRGVHAGNFRWRTADVVAAGTISGVTNAGTHREPVFEPCQPCDAHGFMEGRFCGSIVRSLLKEFIGCRLLGTYRMRFDPGRDGGHGAISGTLEGSLICPCRSEQCTEFHAFSPGAQPNPWTVGGNTYDVKDHTGAPMPNAQVATWGTNTGLNCGYSLHIALGAPVSSLTVRLVHFASPATVDAVSGGSVVASGGMSGPQGVVDSIALSSPSIDAVVIRAPQDETLLLELCTR